MNGQKHWIKWENDTFIKKDMMTLFNYVLGVCGEAQKPDQEHEIPSTEVKKLPKGA